MIYPCIERIGILLWKEARTLRYNIALQFILGLFVVLTVIVTFSEHAIDDVSLTVYFREGGRTSFAGFLRTTGSGMNFPWTEPPSVGDLKKDEVVVTMPNDFVQRIFRRDWPEVTVEYHSGGEKTAQAAVHRFEEALITFMGIRAPVKVKAIDQRGNVARALSHLQVMKQRVRKARPSKESTMVMVCTMSLLIISFNLFSMLLGEEKFSRVLLCQMISPARVGEIILVKFVFYLALNLLLAGIIVGIYAPFVLLQGAFWAVLCVGSLCYMSLSLLVVAYAKKQGTASLLSMGYLFLLGIVVLLSRELAFFATIQGLLPEKYIFDFFAKLFAGRDVSLLSADFCYFLSTAVMLISASFFLFGRKGLQVA